MTLKFSITLALAVVGGMLGIAALPSSALADYDCSDFANQAEAQEYLLPGDPYDLDADGDGIVCEDLPCPCSDETAAPAEEEKPQPPPPYVLSKNVARRFTLAKVRKFTRQHAQTPRPSTGACQRKAERLVDCEGYAKGPERVCKLGFVVKGVHRHPVAKLVSDKCRELRG